MDGAFGALEVVAAVFFPDLVAFAFEAAFWAGLAPDPALGVDFFAVFAFLGAAFLDVDLIKLSFPIWIPLKVGYYSFKAWLNDLDT